MAGPLQSLEAALKATPWPAVVLIGGEDQALMRRLVDATENALDEEERATGIDRFEGGPMARVIDAARTRPLLGGRRLVIARDAEALAAGKDDARDLLLAYIDNPPDHALLVLVTGKIDRRLKVIKEISKKGLLLEGARPREREMPRWIAERAASMELRLAGDAIQLLADAVGTDTALAERELEKIALVAEPENRRPVGAKEIEDLLSPARAVGAFALEDALLGGKLEAAIEALDRHLAGAGYGEPLALLGRLSAISRRLAAAFAVVGQGGGEDAVREALGCHPFVAQKYTAAARRHGARAAAALAACVAADGMLKSGRNPRQALTRIVLALAGQTGAMRG